MLAAFLQYFLDMKNFIKITLLFIAMIFTTSMCMAQGTEIVPGIDFTSVFTTFVALVVAVPILTEALKKMLRIDKTSPKLAVQLFSWVTGIALTMFGWAFNLGFLADLSWYVALGYGLGAALAANGVADTKLIEWIFSLLVKKK